MCPPQTLKRSQVWFLENAGADSDGSAHPESHEAAPGRHRTPTSALGEQGAEGRQASSVTESSYFQEANHRATVLHSFICYLIHQVTSIQTPPLSKQLPFPVSTNLSQFSLLSCACDNPDPPLSVLHFKASTAL
ncbi:hypothetical protein HJG60_010227 [Phyllostomus discolor]|uniref:Uncharacterized protein n=1 Tax=Phyllostomus discolor TaxID=89673 RepID=A0A834EK53_9CHIR|nr:hypothetical protein HJG60_010227 [Phyllostomus discolor]